MPDLYFLECFSWTIIEGGAWQSRLCHSRSPHPPHHPSWKCLINWFQVSWLQVLVKRLVRWHERLIGNLLWLILLVAGLRISGTLKKFWRGARSTGLLRHAAKSMDSGIGNDSVVLIFARWLDRWGLWDCESGEETTNPVGGPRIFCKSSNNLRLNQWERALVLDYVQCSLI